MRLRVFVSFCIAMLLSIALPSGVAMAQVAQPCGPQSHTARAMAISRRL